MECGILQNMGLGRGLLNAMCSLISHGSIHLQCIGVYCRGGGVWFAGNARRYNLVPKPPHSSKTLQSNQSAHS